jgi:hypothetical protein
MAIDRQQIIAQMSQIHVRGNAEGIIPAFNVFIQQLPTDFWNGFARRLVNNVADDLKEAAEALLVNAAHECGYHTGYGIIHSAEWETIVGPVIEKAPEDILHGAFAVFTAWGWAKSEIVELLPKEKMVIRAYDYYESDVIRYGKAEQPCAYMIRGVSAAFMDLAYGDQPYPNGLKTLSTNAGN